ncbi:MAG: DUF3035 domain-containing protein, partial [Alphaproteobacteria bacterium]
GLQDDLGLTKKAPDEFAVVRNAPLSLPPNFNLRPPKLGEIGEGREPQRDQARSLLVSSPTNRAQTAAAAALATSRAAPTPARYTFVAGRVTKPMGEIGDYNLVASTAGSTQPKSTELVAPQTQVATSALGERALLGQLNAINTDSNIRRTVDEEANLLAADDRNLVEKMMFWRKLQAPGVIVEPTGETRRINENSALGEPITKGETPEIRVERLSSGFSGIKLF